MTEVKYNIGDGKEIIAEYDDFGIMEITRECFEALIDKHDTEIRVDERRKFAEWCNTKGYSCYDWRMLIAEYEKEQK